MIKKYDYYYELWYWEDIESWMDEDGDIFIDIKAGIHDHPGEDMEQIEYWCNV